MLVGKLDLLSGVLLSKVKGVVGLMTEFESVVKMGKGEPAADDDPEEGADPGVLIAVPRDAGLTGWGSNLPGLL